MPACRNYEPPDVTWPEPEPDDGAVVLCRPPSEADPELPDLDEPVLAAPVLPDPELPEPVFADPELLDPVEPVVLVLCPVVACAVSASE